MYTQLVMFYNKSSGMDGFSVKEGWNQLNQVIRFVIL